jgi:hypothetical protein
MPYDPRMLQMARLGIGMMGPQQSPFGTDTRNQPQRPKQWWEQPMPVGQSANQPANSPNDANSAADGASSAKPPGMLDMLMGLGRMTPAEYNKRIQGAPPGQQQGLAMVSPWAWLGSMGMPGGAGWGGGGTPG